MSAFDLRVTATAGTTYNLGQRVYGLRFTTQLPGGCAELACAIPAEFGEQLAIPPYLGYNYRVDLLDYGYFWSGRMNYPSLVRDGSGFRWLISAKGYGVSLSDQVSTVTNAQNTQTSTLISNILTSLAPDIDATTITATGFTISNTAAVNINRVTPAMMVAWTNRYGDSSYNPQLATVYPDNDGTVRFTYKPRPTTGDLTAAIYDSERAEIGGEESEYANKVTIQYNSGASYVSASDTAESNKIGLVKEHVAVIPEISQSVDATQAANAILTAKKQLRIAASGPLVYKVGAPIRDTNNALVPFQRVRSGQLVRLVDVSPYQNPLTNLAFFNSFMIAETVYDEDNQTLTITPESYNLALQRNIATVYALITGRHQIA